MLLAAVYLAWFIKGLGKPSGSKRLAIEPDAAAAM
jgi:hypothetical protein